MARKEKLNIRVGLDIGSFSVKYAALSGGKQGSPELIKFGIHKLRSSSMDDLKEALSILAVELPEKNVNISVSGPPVVVRYIQLPKMKKEELASSMEFEAEKYIPFSVKEVILDHQIMEVDAAGKMKVLLVAAKRSIVDSRLKLLEDAGLTADIIDVDSFALINAFCLSNPAAGPEKKIRALLNIGDSLTSVNIMSGDLSQFSRDFLIGGGSVTRAISEKLHVDVASAQNLKHHPESRAAEIVEVSKSALLNISDEIRLSLSYYENQFSVGVNELYISGGGSNQKGVIEFLNENLGIKCQQWDPAKGLSLGPGVSKEELGKSKNELSVAIGLALRE